MPSQLVRLHNRSGAIPNRGDSMRSRAANMNTDRLAFEEAATTVMGPAATAQLQEVVLQELAFQMGRTTDQLSETEKRGAEAISQRVQSTIVAPYVSNITEKANTLCDESRRELLLAANEHTDDSRNLSDIRNKFRKLQDYMIEQHTIYKRAKDEIASLEKQVEELMYDEDGSYIYKDEEDDKKVDNLNKTIKLQQSKAKNAMKKLHTLIDNPMEVGTEEGDNGTIVKEDNSGRGQLKFNKHLDKSSTIEIHQAIRKYLKANCAKLWAIVPWCYYIMYSFDKRDGSYKKPPSIEDGYLSVEEEIRSIYKRHSSELYSEIQNAIGETGMLKVTSTHSVGLHLDIRASCKEDDGVTALWCIYSKFAIKGETQKTRKEELLNTFKTAYTHFASGRPINKVEFLNKKLTEAKKLGVKMPAGDTMEKIIDTLMARGGLLGNKFLPLEEKYKQVIKEYEDNCIDYMDNLFGDINEICIKFETKHIGRGDPWTDSEDRYVNMIDTNGGGPSQSSRGKGKGSRFNSHGSRGHSKGAKGDSRGRDAKGSRGRGKGKGNSESRVRRCQGKDCHEKPSQDKRFCTTCWKRGMEKGYIPMSSGEKFTIHKRRESDTAGKDKKDKYTKLANQVKSLKETVKTLQKRKAESENENEEDEDIGTSAFNTKKTSKKLRVTIKDEGAKRKKMDTDSDE